MNSCYILGVLKKMTPPSPMWGSYTLYMHELPRRAAAVSTTYEGFELLGRLLSVLDGTKHVKSVRMPSRHSALNHFCGGNALVKMSAACSFVSMYLISTDGSSMHSFIELRFILCVRLMCRSFGEKPFSYYQNRGLIVFLYDKVNGSSKKFIP